MAAPAVNRLMATARVTGADTGTGPAPAPGHGGGRQRTITAPSIRAHNRSDCRKQPRCAWRQPRQRASDAVVDGDRAHEQGRLCWQPRVIMRGDGMTGPSASYHGDGRTTCAAPQKGSAAQPGSSGFGVRGRRPSRGRPACRSARGGENAVIARIAAVKAARPEIAT